MPAIYLRDNDALEVNPPPPGVESLSVNGSSWLWAVTAVFIVAFLCYYVLSFKPRNGEKIFHYIYTIALLAGAIAYFAMASNLGWSAVDTANERDRDDDRQIFFAKYIYWVISFPAAILSLGLLSGVAWATIFYNIFLSWVWIISYLISAYTQTNYKWGFFAFGTIAWLALAHSTLVTGRTSAVRVGISRDYMLLTGWLNFIWLMYPLAFGVSDGGNRIGVTASFIWFGILDIMMIPVLAFGFLFLLPKWDYGRLNLHFTQYGRVPAAEGSFPEKQGTAPTATTATAPATQTV